MGLILNHINKGIECKEQIVNVDMNTTQNINSLKIKY